MKSVSQSVSQSVSMQLSVAITLFTTLLLPHTLSAQSSPSYDLDTGTVNNVGSGNYLTVFGVK